MASFYFSSVKKKPFQTWLFNLCVIETVWADGTRRNVSSQTNVDFAQKFELGISGTEKHASFSAEMHVQDESSLKPCKNNFNISHFNSIYLKS